MPQPEGPMKLTKSPEFTVRFTSESAVTGPSAVWKVRSSPRASMTGAATPALTPPARAPDAMPR